jgi:feruloyl esterase
VGWVEHGQPPTRLIASQYSVDGQLLRTRPMCPYPQVARWTGEGSMNDETNFVCA